MLKTSLLFSLIFLGLASAASALTPVAVVVSDAGGKVAYRGATDAQGVFSTKKLPAGNYVVQLTSKEMRGDHAIVVSAGKNKVTADFVSGNRFAGGGIAMKVAVTAAANITGQIAPSPAGRSAGTKDKRQETSADTLQRMQDRGGLGALRVERDSPGR